MRLSPAAREALLLFSGFGFVVAVGTAVFLIWPTHIHGNWRLWLALIVTSLLAIPTVLHLKRRFVDTPPQDPDP